MNENLSPPDPIEPDFELEGPDFYIICDDHEHGDDIVLVKFRGREVEDIGLDSTRAQIVRERVRASSLDVVRIVYGWAWKLHDQHEWRFELTPETAEENAYEAQLQNLDQGYGLGEADQVDL